MLTKSLEEIGLTPKEADVYLALLNLKSASIFEIMSRANVSRKSIYEILQKLLSKGLISYTIKDSKKFFNASHPERLMEILKEKEESLRAALPGMLEKYRESKEEMKVEVFVGKNGIKTISNNILRVGKPEYSVAGNAEMYDYLPYYLPQFIKKRAKLGIKRKSIYNESVKSKNLHPPLTEIRYVPRECGSPIQFTIYGDNVNLYIYLDVPVAIHIQNKKMAHSFMNYFNLMWAIAKK